MRFTDFSPPAIPSFDQQRDALKKGLGRAMQWANQRLLDIELLLAACLKDERFDTQIEDTRGDWLWKMIRTVDVIDRLREPLLRALSDLADERSAEQLCELARCFAEAGDETFRRRLYEIVEQKPIADNRTLGEGEIIQLDGESAFLFAARIRGTQLSSREWEWDDGCPVRDAIERFGEERVNNLLENTTDQAIRLYRVGWLQQQIADAEDPQPEAYRDRLRKITVADIFSAAESDSDRFYPFRGWGLHAEQPQLEIVLQHLWNSHDVNVIVNLLKVFSRRTLPMFDARFLDMCQHADSEVRRWAFNALHDNKHDLIRKFALSQLEEGTCDGPVVSLFAKNYQPGDEQRILDAVVFPDNDFELHSLLMSVLGVLEGNPGASAAQLGIIGYVSTPCGFCRGDFVRALLRQHAVPDWLAEECRFDSSSQVVETIAARTNA